MNDKPIALPVNIDGIPDALKADRRWLNWRYDWRQHEGRKRRWNKLPSGKTNNPTTWTTFDQALAAYQTGGFDGVGFCLGDGWAGIDFDHVLTHPAIERVPCCPSRTGRHAIGRDSRIGGEVKFDAVKPPVFTTWQGARFYAVTGHGEGDPMVDISAHIDEWFRARRMVPTDRPAFIHEGDLLAA
jgi:hypothetical protein